MRRLAAAWARPPGPPAPTTPSSAPPVERACPDACSAERPPRAVWTVAPGDDWATGLAHAAAVTLAAGRGSVLCVPDARDLAVLDAALTTVLGPRPARHPDR